MLKSKILLATIALSLSTLATSAKAELAILDSVSWGSSTYYVLDSASWQDSEARAIELGGHLATINDQDENNFIYEYFGRDGLSTEINANYLWIGLNDEENEGDFVWSSGEDVSYTNFNPGEPNGGTNENYVHIWTFGNVASYWNDLSGIRTGVYGVVEVNNFSNSSLVSNVPSPLFLSAMLPLFLTLRKRRS